MSFFSLLAYRVYAEKSIDSLFRDYFVGYLNFSLVASSSLIFFWSVALQCCIHFCHTMTQISHNYTYIPFLSSLFPFPLAHPSRSPQSTSICPLGYIATSHQLCILHMVMLKLLSPFIPLAPSPTVSTSAFSTAELPFFPCK